MRGLSCMLHRKRGIKLCLFVDHHFPIFGLGMHEQLTLDVVYRLIQCIPELLEVFFIEENLVLFIFLFSDTLALGNCDVEVLFGFCGLYVKEIRAFTRPHPLREDLIFIRVFQGPTTSLQDCCKVGLYSVEFDTGNISKISQPKNPKS
jgi:hypothetical protein